MRVLKVPLDFVLNYSRDHATRWSWKHHIEGTVKMIPREIDGWDDRIGSKNEVDNKRQAYNFDFDHGVRVFTVYQTQR